MIDNANVYDADIGRVHPDHVISAAQHLVTINLYTKLISLSQ